MAGKNNSNQKTVWILILVLSLVLLIGVGILLLVIRNARRFSPEVYHRIDPTSRSETLPTAATSMHTPTGPDQSVDPSSELETDEPGPQENPVDFAALQERNPDAYAWIYIPMGKRKWDVDLPVLQARTKDDDNYYLHHNIDRVYEFTGELYTQKANSKDFTDPVTVIYGHNMYDGVSMFSSLVNFQDAAFFEEHDTFYIYTPGHILTYRIACAIQFDTRHILNCFDFSDEDVFANWIEDYVLHPKTTVQQVRKDLEITTEDRLVVLSTCLEHSTARYLIQGVLISDEPTK